MPSDSLSRTFAALADPTRRAMLARLRTGESSVQDLAKPFKMSAPAITKHLKVLERSGLITRHRRAQWRPCKIEGDALKNASDWLELYRSIWEQRIDRLEEYLETLQKKQTGGTHGDKKK